MNNVVLAEQRDGICSLTLNRPERLNAINPGLITALREALEQANADDNIKVIILQGAGRAFCTGNDLKDTSGAFEQNLDMVEAREQTQELQEITRQIVMSEKMVIGAIHGWAVGAGFEWAINCDFTVWADDARAFFPEVAWGMFATGGVMTLLSRMIGVARAREMLLLGEKYEAQRLLDLGVAWRVVPQSSVRETSIQLAEKIASLPETAVHEFKKTFNQAIFMDLEDTLDAEVNSLIAALSDAGTADRVKRFNKK